MGQGRTSLVRPGLSLSQHRDLGKTLRAMRAQALDLRQTVRESAGSGSSEYQSLTKVVQAVQNAQSVLLHACVGAYVDELPIAELRALYATGEGA